MSVLNDPRLEDLRKRAEALCREEPAAVARMSPDEVQKLVHDLQVHHIELEIQNEELRKAQRELERSRDLYCRLYHQAPAGYLSLDGGGRIQQANKTFAAMMGTTLEDLMRRPFADMIDSADRSVFLARYKAFFKFPDGKSMDLRLLGGGSRRLYARLEGRRGLSPLTGKEGDAAERLFLIIRDVTDQKEAEIRLKESEQRRQLVMAGAQAGAWDWDIRSGEVIFNQRGAEMIGCAAGVPTSRAKVWEERIHPEDRAAVRASRVDHFAGRTPFHESE